MIAYAQLPPSHDLRDWIALYWVGKKERFAEQVPTFLAPDIRIDIILNFSAPCTLRSDHDQAVVPERSAVLFGQTTSPRWGESKHGTVNCLGITFQPGVLPLLLGTRAVELTDSIRNHTFHRALDRWESLAEHAGTAAACIASLEDELRAALQDSQVRSSELRELGGVRKAIEELKEQWRISEICGELGWSRQRLNRLFEKHVGVSPKACGRMFRFQSILEKMQSQGGLLDWAETAIESGYYDQAHMIQEFKEFARTTPSKFVAEEMTPFSFEGDFEAV